MLPLICCHIVKVDLSAWIGDIASDCVRIEEALMDFDVIECYVFQGYSRLGLACAFFVEGVQHAARAITVWFFHLLRADVDSPPNWSIHREVLIVNVLDQPTSLISRIRLHVNTLQRPDHPHIPKRDILHTVAIAFRRHASNRHPDPQNNRTIFHKEVPGAILRAFWLRNHHIVPILNCEVVEVKPRARWVDAICIEREHNDRALE